MNNLFVILSDWLINFMLPLYMILIIVIIFGDFFIAVPCDFTLIFCLWYFAW